MRICVARFSGRVFSEGLFRKALRWPQRAAGLSRTVRPSLPAVFCDLGRSHREQGTLSVSRWESDTQLLVLSSFTC